MTEKKKEGEEEEEKHERTKKCKVDVQKEGQK